MNNVYYNPKDFGMELVDVLDQPDMCYEYNTFIVLKHNGSGRIFFAHDSGCSCPTPFEDYHFSVTEDGIISTNLTELTKASQAAFEAEVNNFPVTMEEKQSCLVKVKTAQK